MEIRAIRRIAGAPMGANDHRVGIIFIFFSLLLPLMAQ
jgi:hypothetical protein